MFKKGNEFVSKVGNMMIDKLKELKDPNEIGKCLRTFIRTVGAGYIVKVICQNGINYKNKFFIGTTKNEF